MKTTLLTLALAAVAIPSAAFACDGHSKQQAAAPAPAPTVKKLTIAEFRANKQAQPVDANTPDYRVLKGIIPKSVMLTSPANYDLAELPENKDTQLVFYCANTKCLSSETAAERALQAGYTNVAVMPVGMEGWKKAGLSTTPVKPQS